MTTSDPLNEAQRLPGGARFYRCALQVNPFEYLSRHSKPTQYSDEASYNSAIVAACQENQVEVIAVTDHDRIGSSRTLIEAARAAGILVFPGFEAVTKDGVHMLCIFSPDRSIEDLERIIGDCGIHDDDTPSPAGKYDVTELLEASETHGSLCVAAHVASAGGLLWNLSNQPRVKAWKSKRLLACSLPGPITDAPQASRAILQNSLPEYRRERRVAVINAQDVSSPDDLSQQGATCFVKMSEVSLDGLRQAFLDPDSRIRLPTDPIPEAHSELVAIAWQGGFLDGTAIHFNENLNVLIGGRGSGKSTVIESLRYVLGLEPIGEDARKAHDGIVRNVLRSGTKISLLIRSHRPTTRRYVIERTVPNPIVVRDDAGQVVPLTIKDVIPRVEVYGQHEISDITKSPQKLTRLLDRFTQRNLDTARRKEELVRELERSRSRVLELKQEMKQVEDRLASLPALEETLRAFQNAGLEERLKDRSLLVREERLLKTVGERIAPFVNLLEQLRGALPIDRAFLSTKALADLPGKEILAEADGLLEGLNNAVEQAVERLEASLKNAEAGTSGIRKKWESRRDTVVAAYEKILRELQRSKVDGEEFIKLRHQIEELRPLKEREAALRRDLNEHETRRKSLLVEWEEVKGAEYRELEGAAKKVSRALGARVRVKVSSGGNREPLFDLLRKVGGRLSEAIAAIEKLPTISLVELATAVRTGRDKLVAKFGLPQAQADRIAQADGSVAMQIEELDLAPTTRIELNVAPEGQPESWQALDDLSTGQKATAVLLLLLLESDAPLVIDQPEDDLDNRFITEGIVPKMREEKRQRQFVVATHNANVPVLGDAELIVALTPTGDATQGKAAISTDHMASIDAKPIRELVEELLEGGKVAFETRRLKYGF